MVGSRKDNNTMKKSTKEVTPKRSIKEIINPVIEVVIGVSTMAFVVAESIAAYVMYFSGNTQALKIVAGVLLLDAAIRATKAFTKR
jgi:hypothetical protein